MSRGFTDMLQMNFKKIMALVAMAFLWTGSQIPAYLYGGIPPYSKPLLEGKSIQMVADDRSL
jgi:hypothetical protein